MVPSLNGPLGEDYDVLIVGGGIYGVTAAYEASRRGLSVLIVEREDWGSGTSSNSMKIVHGGLRYLQDRDLGRVLRSHGELRTLLAIAPHLIRRLHCELRLDSRSAAFRLKFRAGLTAFRLLTALARPAIPDAPGIPAARYPCWHDGIIEDTEQLLLDYLHTAVSLGGGRTAVRNYAPLEEYSRRAGRIVAARIGGVGEIGVGRVIECTGTWRKGMPVRLAMNVVVDRPGFLTGDRALGLPHPYDGRFAFVVPWRGRAMVGTFERDYPYDPTGPLRLQVEWLEEFLGWLAPIHPELAALELDSIRFVHAGLLPKDAPEARAVSRTDRVVEHDDGRIEVVGVKYTTARALGSRVADAAARALGREVRDAAPPRLVDRRESVRAFARTGEGLDEPLSSCSPSPTHGDLLYAVEHEQARTLADVLLRRCSVATAGLPNEDVVLAAASSMQRSRGWSDDERSEEIERFVHDLHFGPPRVESSAD